MEYFDKDVKQWKVNIFVKDILDRLLQENFVNITLTAAAYGSSHTESASAVQFCKQAYSDVIYGVSGIIYTSAMLFRNKKLYNKFRYSMTKAAQVFNADAISTIALQVSDLKEKQDGAEQKAMDIIAKELEKIKKENNDGGQGESGTEQKPTNPELNKINKDDEESQENLKCGDKPNQKQSNNSSNTGMSFDAGDDFEW